MDIHFPKQQGVVMEGQYYRINALKQLSAATTVSDLYQLNTYMSDNDELAGGFTDIRLHIASELNQAALLYTLTLTIEDQVRIAIELSNMVQITGPFPCEGMYGFGQIAADTLSQPHRSKLLSEWLSQPKFAYNLTWLVAEDMVFDIDRLKLSALPLLAK